MALSKRFPGVLVLGVLVVSLGLQFVPLTIGTFVAVNTETQRFEERGWTGTGSASFDGELLDGSQIITSWMENGDSEKVIAQGRIKSNLFNPNLLWGCRYVWEINWGFGWNPIDLPVQDVPCPSTFVGGLWEVLDNTKRVLHTPLVGGIAVDLQVNVGLPFLGEWFTVARDEARLRPGVGDVAVDKPTYAIGETAIIRYDVGYASSQRDGGTWTIVLYEPRDRGGDVRKDWPIGPGPGQGQVTYTFAVTDFVAGESNLFRVELLNTITGVKDDDFAVVDDVDLAPVILSVSVQPPGTRKVGDEMTATVVAAPNELTGLVITAYYFHVRAGPATIIMDAWQATSVFTFTIQSDGDIQVNACVRDAERSSCARRINVVVEEPDNPVGKEDADPYTAPWWMWVGIGFLGAALLGIQFTRIPEGGKKVLSLFLFSGMGVLFLSYLVIPTIQAWLQGVFPGVS